MLICFACNNPDNGTCRERASDMNIADPLIEMSGRELVVRGGGEVVQVGRRKFQAHGSVDWVGNWCWDGWHVTEQTAVQIVNYLIERGWTCYAGPSDVYEQIKSGKLLGIIEQKKREAE